MKSTIENIFQNLKIFLPNIERARTLLWRQDFYRANNLLRVSMQQIEEVVAGVLGEREYFSQAAADTSQENIMLLLNSLFSVLDQREYVLLADILSQSVLPFFYALQEYIVMQELAEPVCFSSGVKDYLVEYTSCGLPTVQVQKEGEGFYLHSNRNARQEAEEIAASWMEPEKTDYIIYGMGLGYAVTALLDENEYSSVRVFESDAVLMELSRQYGDYQKIVESGRATIEIDQDGTKFAQAAAKNPQAAIGFFYPSLRLISEKQTAERMEELFINYSSQKIQYPAMCGNFKRNVFYYDEPVDVLKPQFEGKRVYLVAGGPSLDKNIDVLKKANKNGIIVAVGTVLKKLLSRGIRPDYVAFSDAKSNTFRQVEGICDAEIPMWGLSTTYWRFFTDYHAKHYLVCQEGFEPAEKFAKEKGYFLIETFGTVFAVAMNTAIQLGASEIVFVGLDLAFTEGKHHAEGMGHDANQTYGGQRMVQDIYGTMIPTGKNLDIYRKAIEKKIEKTKGVRFINATEGGAEIKGTELLLLAEVADKNNI